MLCDSTFLKVRLGMVPLLALGIRVDLVPMWELTVLGQGVVSKPDTFSMDSLLT